MRIRKTLLIVLLLLASFIILTTVVISRGIVEKNKILLDNKLESTKLDHQRTRVIHDRAVFEVIKHLSILRDAGKANPDSSAMLSSFLPILKMNELNYVWFYNSAGHKLLSLAVDEKDSTALPFVDKMLVDSLQNNTPCRFVENINGHYVELYANAVHGVGEDGSGLCITAKKLDDQYAKALMGINAQTSYELVPYSSSLKTQVDPANNEVVDYEIFYNHHHNALYALKITGQLDALKEYQRYINTSLFTNAGVIILCLMMFFFFSKKIIFDPLRAISNSLAAKDARAVKPLLLKSSEFGEISQLITDAFIQNKLMAQEIESRKQSEAALKEALEKVDQATSEKREADEANKTKSQFLSVMSHEIRTPVNGVIGIANLLLDEELTVKQREYVNILHFSSRHLMSLVSDVLDFSKIEAGNIEFDKSVFNLKHLCEGICFLFRPKAEEKGIALTFTPDLSITTLVSGDQVRLGQIITNLVSNAIKFTFQGSVELSYKKVSDARRRMRIEFTVKDTGIGIKPEEQESIFESFTQGKGGKKYGGTGLGLTISKKLVQLQGGNIMVSSVIGQGSTFMFELELEKNVFQQIIVPKHHPKLRPLLPKHVSSEVSKRVFPLKWYR